MTIKTLTDKDSFLSAIRLQERWAVKQLYNDGYGMCENYILKNSGNKDDAFDCFQEAMIVVIRKVKQTDFQLQSKLSTYLFAVTRNLWLKQLRSKGNMSFADSSEEMLNNIGEIEEADEKEEKLLAIEKGLSALSEECRALIKEYYYKRIDLKLLADNMGYSYKFIRVKKMRCMNKLKEVLEPMMTNIEL